MTLELKTPKERATHASNMAKSFGLVRYHNITYVPSHYETGDSSFIPAPEETVWLPLPRDSVRRLAASQYGLLFASDGELNGFDFMVAQNCVTVDHAPNALLVRTPEGLRQLNHLGQLVDVTGQFVPNAIIPMLNEDETAKKEVLATIAEWVDSDEEAHSLLRHLATSLAPGWSAVKYVLLLGEGRNGKSLLLKMVHNLFGTHNVSNVTRQHMAEQNPVLLDLNGKLVNIVYDGRAKYLDDSGTEKSIIAGEIVPIRRLYESTATPVQTTALFLEGLNREPKSNDKSSALQKRLVRYLFPNVYALDHKFERKMLGEDMLGAFLSVLIDHYVTEDDVAGQLAPTSQALELQLEHMYVNSMALQFLKHVMDSATFGIDDLIDAPLSKAVQEFQAWRIKNNDMSGWAEPDVEAQLRPLLNNERRTRRTPEGPRKVRIVTGLKQEAQAFVDSLKGDADEDSTAAVVED